VPFGKAQRKKDVAMGVALPPESGTMYGGKPILPDYAWVYVTWTNVDFDEGEIDIPTEEGYSSSALLLAYECYGIRVTLSWTCRCWRHSPHSHRCLPWVTQMMTVTMTTVAMTRAAMTTTMLATQAVVLQPIHLLATSIHGEA
jgi:hypothetical protein